MTATVTAAAGVTSVVLGGLSANIASHLEEILGGASVRISGTGEEVIEQIKAGGVSLLVLDHDLEQPAATLVLRQLRDDPELAGLPVLYLLDRELREQMAEELVGGLGVARILFHPVDKDDVARQIADLAGLPLPPTVSKSDKLARTARAVALIWENSRTSVFKQIDVVEEAITSMLMGDLDEATRRLAQAESHKLAGSVGTFGFADGSRIAREIEALFMGEDENAALRLSELVLELRRELEKPVVVLSSPDPAPETGHGAATTLMVVSQDLQLSSRLIAEAATKNFKTVTATSVAQARKEMLQDPPSVALLDFALHDAEEELGLLEEMAGASPPVPCLVFTSSVAFKDRLEVARRGGRGFVDRTVPPQRVIEAVSQLLAVGRLKTSKVLAVDDDTVILETLKAVLEPHAIKVTPLAEPLKFWEVLEESAPDLIMLDIDMPGVSGVELCRVIRNDPRWATTPVIFLTAHTSPEIVRSVFDAGADDFLTKPVVGPEVVMRIQNRLERVGLFRSMAETDSLTGVANRRKSTQVMNSYLRLAERYLQPFALATVDIDHLKDINNVHGHSAGDRVLRKFSEEAQKLFRGEDVIARWAGEEFVVGMYGMTRDDGVVRVAEVLEAMREVEFRGADAIPFRVTFSSGVAQYPEDGLDIHELYKSSDEALQQAKGAGGHRVLPAGWDPSAQGVERFDVVMVEDDESLAALLAHALETRGYRSHWIKDGEKAAAALGGAHPTLKTKVILLDVDLPGLDGIGVLRRLSEFGGLRTTRVIMLTVRANEKEVLKTLELGAFDHVAKPFSVPILMQRIRRAMGE